jgi:hypothetical protein
VTNGCEPTIDARPYLHFVSVHSASLNAFGVNFTSVRSIGVHSIGEMKFNVSSYRRGPGRANASTDWLEIFGS